VFRQFVTFGFEHDDPGLHDFEDRPQNSRFVGENLFLRGHAKGS
jgi:hypothetical protein